MNLLYITRSTAVGLALVIPLDYFQEADDLQVIVVNGKCHKPGTLFHFFVRLEVVLMPPIYLKEMRMLKDGAYHLTFT